ncbi:hypothetical protein DFAR_1540046 [Desulfarculales bacterium]
MAAGLTKKQQQALAELKTGGLATHRLAAQGGAALDQKGYLCAGRPVAHHPLHPLCPEVHSA